KMEETKSQALMAFPSASHFDWQWAEIIQNVRAVNLDSLPAELEPVVWAIDDWNRNYKLGVIFELAVGDGRLLVSAFDVSNPASPNPVARQLRYSLLKYARSDCFQPQVSVSPEQVRSLFFDTRVMKKLGAVAEVNGGSANAAIDGDPNTFIVVGDQGEAMREQVDLMITLNAPAAMSGMVLMQRQNHREHEGDIRAYVLQVSDDGRDWREVARGELLSTFAPQQIDFSSTVTARYLKFIALSGFGVDKTTALAELAVVRAPDADKKPKPKPPRPKP
ncbi:MAG TPA: discoidin domain-containing protein, partial [Pyrinomonadaceae bacterium]|nr:discoidin domain-containing protein [Pyrinomonadaceae bacterium]